MGQADETEREAAVGAPDGGILARLDLGREARCGAPEAIFAQGKTPRDTLAISETLVERQGHALVTRAGPEAMALLRARWPDLRAADHAGAALVGTPPAVRGGGHVAVVCAGTSDLAVAEDAVLTLAALGHRAEIVADVGVAGLHRLLGRLEDIRRAGVVIAVAGMEGALPSVLAGLIAAPVIAVPTSVGYGASLGGLSALLGMLNSCSPGISVVNIDNGFGAAMAASRMLRIHTGSNTTAKGPAS
jgi:NCAIR mutase (PurE)-related protein